MAILFMILKIIGIIVLVIVILLALILFAPVTYRVQAESTEKYVKARAAWLGGVLSLRFIYEDAETDFGVFLFGIRAHKPKFIDRILEFRRKRQRKKAKKDPDPEGLFETDEPKAQDAKEQDVGRQDSNNQNSCDHGAVHPAEEIPPDADSDRQDSTPADDAMRSGKDGPEYTLPADEVVIVRGEDGANDEDFPEDESFDEDFSSGHEDGAFSKIKSRFGGGRFSPDRIIGFVKLFWEYKQKGLYGKILQALKKFLFRARPRHLSGRAAFGFEDPARTGQVLGTASVVPFLVNSDLRVEPDFETEKTYFEGNADLRGRLHLVFAVVLAVRLFTNKDFRKFMHQVRHS